MSSGSKTARKPNYSMKDNRSIKRLVKKNISATTAAIVSTDNKIAALKRRVKLQSEYRYKDTVLAFNSNNEGTMTLLNGMGSGTGNGLREGTHALMKQVRIKLNLVAADTTNILRVILFIAKAPQGTVPDYQQLLDTTIIPATLAFRLDGQNEQFTVLHDKTYAMVSLSSSGAKQQRINKRINLKTNYGLGSAGTIADITYGALYLYIVSDSGASAHPAINGGVRVRYTS